jgi:acyl carrier protein
MEQEYDIIKIQDELKEYITALLSPSKEITNSSTLDDMNIDSLALVKIFVFVEKNFGISLSDSGLSRENIETFGKLSEYIFKLINKKNY